MFLVLFTHRNFSKLRVRNNNKVVFSCKNTTDKAFAIFFLEVLRLCNQNTTFRKKLVNFTAKLFNQRFWDNKKRLLSNAQFFHFSCTGKQCERFTCAHLVSKSYTSFNDSTHHRIRLVRAKFKLFC